MVVLDGNFAVGCGPGTNYSQIHLFQCIAERTDAVTSEVLEPIMFVLAYPTVFQYFSVKLYHAHTQCCLVIKLYATTQPGLLAL
jgi:hypothetical protein